MSDDGHHHAKRSTNMALDPHLAAVSSARPVPTTHKRKSSAATQPSHLDRASADMIVPPTMGVFARDSSRAIASVSGAKTSAFFEAITTAAIAPSASSSHNRTASNASRGVETTAADDGDGEDDDQGTVDEDAGVIRCICDCDDDDGFTIQCDRCLVWQHCACFGMSQASVPDEYLCEQCAPRPVDVAFAQAIQQKRKNDEARKALLDRNLKRHTQSSNTAAAAFVYANGQRATEATAAVDQRAGAGHLEAADSLQASGAGPLQGLHDNGSNDAEFDVAAANGNSNTLDSGDTYGGTAARPRKPTQALDLSNTQFVVPEVPANVVQSGGAGGRSGAKRKGQKGSRSRSGAPETPMAHTPNRGTLTPSLRDDRYDNPFDTVDKLEAWRVEFTPIAKNMVADQAVLGTLAAAMLDWEDGSPLRALPGHGGKLVIPVQRAAARRRMQLAAARAEEMLVTTAEKESGSAVEDQKSRPLGVGARPPSADQLADLDYAELGLAAVGNECIPIDIQGGSLVDLGAKTYVRHISETASAGVFCNVLQLSSPADEPQRTWNASRSFSRPVMHGLFAEGPIPAGAFICEYRGELYSADTYRQDPVNQYAALGAAKPYVHLLPPPLNLAIDARRFGNEGRFARFSCHPNAVLRPILFRQRGATGPGSLLSQDCSRSPTPAVAKSLAADPAAPSAAATAAIGSPDKPRLLFGLFALTDIARTHEITLGWEWDDAHIVHFLPELVQNPFMEPREWRTPNGTPRSTFDAERHTANMVAIAERGEFPYASTAFSAKMNAVAASLLGCVLCACIGSAAAPGGGGGGASANNARKQDCAVAQMLRVGNGMSLLNVVMPGKTNRRAKLPDFAPLVGIRRSWMPPSMPPTPASSIKEGRSPTAEHAGSGGAEFAAAQMMATELLLADAGGYLAGEAPIDDVPMACGQADGVTAEGDAEVTLELEVAVDGEPLLADIEMASPPPLNEDAYATESDASSLTDPLSLASSGEDESADEDDLDHRCALHFTADGDVMDTEEDEPTSPTQSGEESAVDAGIFVLPLKKRVTRTRIKATLASSDSDSSVDDESKDAVVVPRVRSDKAEAAAARLKAAQTGQKRKAKARTSRPRLNATSDEPEVPRPNKKRKKGDNTVDPSSPLSSVPSPGSRYSSLSPPPSEDPIDDDRRSWDSKTDFDSDTDASVSRGASSRRMTVKLRAKGKRAAGRTRPQRGGSSGDKSEETASTRKKKAKARLLRDSIADMGDPESSDDDGDASVHVTASPASSRAKATTLSTPPKKASRPHKSAKGSVESAAKPSRKEQIGKPKKNRRVVSDTESEDSDADQTPRPYSRPKAVIVDSSVKPDPDAPTPADARAPGTAALAAKSEVGPSAGDAGAISSAPAEVAGTADAPSIAGVRDVTPDASTSRPPTAPAPAPPSGPAVVKEEEPRVKLSLAEYKRRLAERRTTAQVALPKPSPPATPGTPTSDSGQAASATTTTATMPGEGSHGKATLASEQLSDVPDKAAATANNFAPTSALAPGSSGDSTTRLLDAPPVAPAPKRPSTPPRSQLFASVAAPTAIRSVELPRSPPMVTRAPSEARQASSVTSATRVETGEARAPPPQTSTLRPGVIAASPAPSAASAPASAGSVEAAVAAAAVGRVEAPPPPKTPPMKRAALPAVTDGTEAGAATASVRPFSSTSSFATTGAPILISRLELERDSVAAPPASTAPGELGAAGRKMRPVGFQPIGGRPSPTSSLSLTSTSGSWTTLGGGSRAGFVPVGGAMNVNITRAASPPHQHGGALGHSTIPGRSLSVSSASSSGGAPRQLLPSPGFNPPRAPRAFLSTGTPTGAASPPTTAVGAGAALALLAPVRPPPMISSANAASTVMPLAAHPLTVSTTAPGPPNARHATPSMSPPSPTLSLHSLSTANLRDFAGVPTGPASMRERDGRSDKSADREWEREPWGDPRGERPSVDRSGGRPDQRTDRERESLLARDRDREWEREPREPLTFRSGSFDDSLADRLNHLPPLSPFSLGASSGGGGSGLARGGRGGNRGGARGGGGGGEGRDHLDDGSQAAAAAVAATATPSHFLGPPSGGRGFGGRGGGGGGWGARARGRGGGRLRGGGGGGWGGPTPPPQAR